MLFFVFLFFCFPKPRSTFNWNYGTMICFPVQNWDTLAVARRLSTKRIRREMESLFAKVLSAVVKVVHAESQRIQNGDDDLFGTGSGQKEPDSKLNITGSADDEDDDDATFVIEEGVTAAVANLLVVAVAVVMDAGVGAGVERTEAVSLEIAEASPSDVSTTQGMITVTELPLGRPSSLVTH